MHELQDCHMIDRINYKLDLGYVKLLVSENHVAQQRKWILRDFNEYRI